MEIVKLSWLNQRKQWRLDRPTVGYHCANSFTKCKLVHYVETTKISIRFHRSIALFFAVMQSFAAYMFSLHMLWLSCIPSISLLQNNGLVAVRIKDPAYPSAAFSSEPSETGKNLHNRLVAQSPQWNWPVVQYLKGSLIESLGKQHKEGALSIVSDLLWRAATNLQRLTIAAHEVETSLVQQNMRSWHMETCLEYGSPISTWWLVGSKAPNLQRTCKTCKNCRKNQPELAERQTSLRRPDILHWQVMSWLHTLCWCLVQISC